MTKKKTPRLSELLDEVQMLCRGPENYGRKSELARFIGVSPQFVHNWLVSRVYEPGGEATLAMLEWVQARRSQKGPGRARTRPERQTQVRKSRYEKRTQASKKR